MIKRPYRQIRLQRQPKNAESIMKYKPLSPVKKGFPWALTYALLIMVALCLAAVLLFRDARVQKKLHRAGMLKSNRPLAVDPEQGNQDILAAESETTHTGNSAPVGFSLPRHIVMMRPRPQDYDFKAMREQLRAYMDMIPPENKEIERERIRYLGSYKDYLVSKMQKLAYTPEDDNLLLADGRRIQGSITVFSNAQTLKIRLKNSKKGSLAELKCNELSQEEFFKIAHSYVRRQADSLMGHKIIPATRLNEIFDEYLYLILLADWYQKDDLLRQYCREFSQLPIAEKKNELLNYIQWPEQLQP